MSGSYIGIDTHALRDYHIPVPIPNKHHYVVVPKRLRKHVSLRHCASNTLHALFTKAFDIKSQQYALTYHIPLVQLSSEDIDEVHHNHMYVHLCMTGKYERHNLQHHIRIEKLTTCVIVLPVFMSANAQASLLLSLPSNHNVPTHLRTHRLHFVETHSIESVNKAFEQAVSPTAQAYVETSAKSRYLQQMEQQAQHALTVGAHIQTYDRLPKDTGRQPGKILKQLKYYYGPNVIVKELDKTMLVLEDVVSTAYKLPNIRNITHATPTTIREQMQHLPLESYINNKSKLAVVAVLPQMHLTHQFHIVAVALFEFVPAVLVARAKRTSRHSSQRAHIVLQHLLVDHRYDEYILDPKHHSSSNGIRQQLIQSALPYTQKVFGPHDVLYKHQHKRTYRALLASGFAKEAQPSTLSHRIKATLKRRKPTLKYTAKKTITCSTWEECKQLVQEKYPNMKLKDVLVMASELCPSSRDKTAPTTPRRSRRPVSAQQGAKILQAYYTQKLLVPAGVSLEMSKKEVESAMADEEKAQAIRAYCKAIRNHLQRTRKHTVLTTAKKNTWKYRPDPNEGITPDSKQGPDKYVLEELDAKHELGEALVKRPMGRSTPTALCGE